MRTGIGPRPEKNFSQNKSSSSLLDIQSGGNHLNFKTTVIKFYNIAGKNLFPFSCFNPAVHPDQPVGNHILGLASAGRKIFKLEHLVQFHRGMGNINDSVLSHGFILCRLIHGWNWPATASSQTVKTRMPPAI